MKEYSFEKLEAWKEAKKLILDVYKLTIDYPSEEKFGLVNQMRRAALSVASNLAEGSGRSTAKDQAHFSQIAYSSLLELLNQLIISVELGMINCDQYLQIREKVEQVSYLIAKLRKAQKEV